MTVTALGNHRHPVPCARAWVDAPARVALTFAAGAGLDVALDPTRTHIPLCPFHSLTGLVCPLCGGLRAIDELLRGNVASALRDNLLVLLAVPVAVSLWWLWAGRLRTGRPGPRLGRRARGVLIVVLVVFTIVRNLPIAATLRPA